MKKVLSVCVPATVILSLLALPAAGQITKVVNGASFASNNKFTAGSIITIKGGNLATTTVAATNSANPPKTLGGVTVTIGGVASALFYVSPAQINARIDPSLSRGVKQLVVTTPGHRFTTQIEIVAAGSAGIFTLRGTGARDGAILNARTFKLSPFSVTTGNEPTYLAIFATGLDLSTTPVVTVDGIPMPVLWAGNAPGFFGLQQINVRLLPQLAGAGRVEVVVTAGGRTTNVVEIVILPNASQVSWWAELWDNTLRNRELAAIAWIPGTSLALLADENDDVVRLLDIKNRKVLRTITLPTGAEPVAVAVNTAGKIAVVAERDRDRVAILDLNTYKVVQEVKVGGGPSAVAILGDRAVVLNLDTDNVSIVSLATSAVTATVPVGRSPRGIATDILPGDLWRAYVTNQNEGTISVIDLKNGQLAGTVNLGEDVRPQSILAMMGTGIGVVTEPSRNKDGRVLLVNLITGAILDEVNVNPDGSGGASALALYGNTIYFANQSAGSVTAAQFTLGPTPTLTAKTIKVGIGVRALAVDALDKLLLVTNQGSGEVVLIDLTTNAIAGKINGVRAEDESDDANHNRDDRDRAANVPAITSMSPSKAKAGTTFALTLAGKNLEGAIEVVFLKPGSLTTSSHQASAEMLTGVSRQPYGTVDAAIQVTYIQVSGGGTKLIANVAIASGASRGDRVVQVRTINGESTNKQSSANTFEVER